MTVLQIENLALYYYLLAGLISAIKESVEYRKHDTKIDSIFISIIIFCFFIGFMLLPIQIYNYLWEAWKKSE